MRVQISRVLRAAAVLYGLGLSLGPSGLALANRSLTHTVLAGDTLWDISRSYGCEVEAIRQVNPLVSPESGDEHLDVGQVLRIPHCDKTTKPKAQPAPAVSVITHEVAQGDTLSDIASQYSTTVGEIVERNELPGTDIRAGAQLSVLPGAKGSHQPQLRLWKPKSVAGQSIGLPYRGRLKKAIRLKKGSGYFIRRPHRSYGATHTVGYLQQSLAKVRRRFPQVHDLAIGDLSAREGGKITMHASHQTGRDVDIGFFFKKKPKGYPENFIVANRKNVDFKASWALLTQFTKLAKKPFGVERIFMSYSSQRMFYKLARKHGVSKKELKEIFQYPAGKWAREGIIRHVPKHDEHFHVRFKCPPKDKRCL